MSVEISLLGRFGVRIDGVEVPAAVWSRRQAASLVKMLALAPRRTLHREQVMDALWPDLPVDDASPRLHKAAHFARRALGPDSVVLRSDSVALLPDAPALVDVARFEELAARARDSGDPADAAAAAAAYGGPLLPEDRYESWAGDARDRLHLLYLQMLRLARRWAELVEADPTDAQAQLALMREHVDRGDRRAALRQFERMDRALHTELGVRPSDEAIALRDSLLASAPDAEPAAAAIALVGREQQAATLERVIGDAAQGRGRTVFLSGAAGMGKSVLAEWLRRQVTARGWRSGHGAASSIEGAWPYAPVLEAIADLCRRHPSLLDGLDDRCRHDIDRALAGRALDWDGDGSHQRLFVALAELLRLASSGSGALLTIDNVQEADEASLRLLHYLARSCHTERLIIALCHRRQSVTDTFEQFRASLLRRSAVEVPLSPLDQAQTRALADASRPGLTAEDLSQIWSVSGGVPFAIVELARTAGSVEIGEQGPGEVVLGLLTPTVRGALELVATTGSTFDTDEFLALSGLPEDEAFECLDAALAALVLERTMGGYRFRHPLIRDALLAAVPPHRQRAMHRSCAQRLIALGATPARIGHHLLAAGAIAEAVPYVLRAAETEAALGAYHDALALVDSVRAVVEGPTRQRALALRADLLAATGDPAAMPAFRQAIAAASELEQRPLRAKMARVAAFSGDLETATAALAGLELDGGPADRTILLARGNLEYFRGDLDAAWATASAATHAGGESTLAWEYLDLISLKGLITHNRGEWSQLLQLELKRTREDPVLATAMFDSHLCVAEYLLYGPTPYEEVIGLARTLRETAERAGALRAVGFATALIGEAALLSGDLDMAERELTDAIDIHREIGATMGEAHSIQRLAEVQLARGDRAAANRLLRRALPLARWSILAMHLLQRVYGTMIRAADDAEAARAVVDSAEATIATTDACYFCSIMFEVPAAIACADAGDLSEARRHLALAEKSASLWEGTAWQAAMLEARAALARAEGDHRAASRALARAAELFDASAQPLDAARCRAALAGAGDTRQP